MIASPHPTTREHVEHPAPRAESGVFYLWSTVRINMLICCQTKTEIAAGDRKHAFGIVMVLDYTNDMKLIQKHTLNFIDSWPVFSMD